MFESQQYASREVVVEKDSEVVKKKETRIKSRTMTQGKQMWGRGSIKEKKKDR